MKIISSGKLLFIVEFLKDQSTDAFFAEISGSDIVSRVFGDMCKAAITF